MSHFTVAVFSKERGDVEDLLAPFDENIAVAPYVKYTRQQAIDWVRENINSMKEASDDDCYSWLADEYRDEGRIDMAGNLISTYNPNSKWDWWDEGGRWNRMLKLHNGMTANYARCSEVDFSGDQVVYDDAIRFWQDYVEGDRIEQIGPDDDDYFDYRKMYKREYYIDRYQTKEAYAKDMSSFKTYAFIEASGVWHETGKIGWWGTDDATNESRMRYNEQFEKYIEYAIQNDLCITIVDCHI